MKNNWQTKKLGEICNISSGNSAPQKEEFFKNGAHYFFRTSDVGNIHIGIIFESRDKLNDKGIKNLTLFKKNTILFPKSGASTFLNHRVILGSDGYVSSHLATIKAKEEILIDKFLFYFLILINAKTLVQDQNYPSLQIRSIQNINISFPGILEQKRIVEILDKSIERLEKVKENTEKNLKNSKELFESYLNNIFSNPKKDWEKKELGEICDFVRGPFGGSLKKSIFKKEGYVVYEQQHAIYNQFTDVRYFIDENKFNEMRRFKLEPGDLIMSCSGTMGKIAIAPIDLKKGIINQALLKLSPHSNLNNKFLKLWMESGVFQNDLKFYTKGAAIKNVVSVKILKEIKLSIPCIEEQKLIVKKTEEFSEKTKRLEEIYKKKLEDIEELKKSILNKAFSGEL